VLHAHRRQLPEEWPSHGEHEQDRGRTRPSHGAKRNDALRALTRL